MSSADILAAYSSLFTLHLAMFGCGLTLFTFTHFAGRDVMQQRRAVANILITVSCVPTPDCVGIGL